MVSYLHALPKRPSCYRAHTLHSSLAVDIDVLTKALCLMIIDYNNSCWLFSRMLYPPLKGPKMAKGYTYSLPTVLLVVLRQSDFFSNNT